MEIRKIITLFFLFSSVLVMGQGFVYSYIDPCSAKSKEMILDTSNGGVPLSYNGQVQIFTDAQLQAGDFQTWIDLINNQNPTGPCSGVGLLQSTTTNVLIAANNISVITNVLSTISSMASMAAVSTTSSVSGSAVQGIIQSDEKVSSNNNDKKENENGTNNTNGNSSTTGTNQTSPSVQGVKTTSSGTGTNNTNQGGSNTTTNNSTPTGSESSQSSVEGNSTAGISSVKLDNTEKAEAAEASTASSSSTTKSKVAAVKKGNLMATGDIVTIASANGGEPQQVKINASFIASNTKNTFAKGALLNFTSGINNSSLTFFVSYRRKHLTTILANSIMLNFESDFFNTISLMESYEYRKVTLTLGANYTVGNIGASKFQSLSSLVGAFSSFKINKKMGLTTMFVVVYSPYVYYYQDMWWQSGLLAVPFVSVDYKISKKFKFNLSFSGVQQINDKTISYQILTGAKCML